ncbi:MAG: hypothetical protein ACFFD1_13080 [Candidatus Thorarchaeota archaeon]
MSENNEIHHIFELFSHPIRLKIVKILNIGTKQFSEMMSDIGSIEGALFNFHLQKLIKGNIVERNEFDRKYNLTEFGLKNLSFIEAYQSGQLFSNEETLEEEAYEEEKKVGKIEHLEQTTSVFIPKIPTEERSKNLPPGVRTIPFMMGKHANSVEDSMLSIPKPIKTNISPKKWINEFISPLKPIIDNKKSILWLEERMLKLAYGTRGLHDFSLMDSSFSVPPLESFFNTITNDLISRGKSGLFAKTGMGKSRLLLYLANWWMSNYDSSVLLIDNPKNLDIHEWEKLHSILSESASSETENKWLLIIDDVHLTDQNCLEYLRRIISNSGQDTWSSLIAYTEIQERKYQNKKFEETIEEIKREILPVETIKYLDLSEIWPSWRPYFHEWIQWVGLDVLNDYIPWKSQNWNEISLQSYSSPWSFVVSLGFLKSALDSLQRRLTDNIFPLTLYSLLAILFILREEQGIELTKLCMIIKNSFSKELDEIYPNQNWEKEISEMLEGWTSPVSRLIPPFHYYPVVGSLKKERVIRFYHQAWAIYVCEFLLSKQKSQIYTSVCTVFERLANPVYVVWKLMNQELPESKKTDFLTWIRNNTRFDIYKEKSLLLTYLNFDKEEIKVVKKQNIGKELGKDLSEIDHLNLSFIKAVIANI